MSGPVGASPWMYGIEPTFYEYDINQSLRFNAADSANLLRTPSSASNRATWTWSAWVKRSNLGGNATLFCSAAGDYNFKFHTDNKIKFEGHFGEINTAAVFRDVSAWYHIVAIHDTTEGTDSNRFKVFVNGVQQTMSGTFPSGDGVINSTTSHGIGGQTSANYFDGYMAEIHFIDGTAVAATSFGETKDNIWIPKEYSGSYGTNGFYLPFDDGSAIGDDESGNTNDWTANNLAATDIMPDTPINNFATLNTIYHSASQAVLLEGNLKADTAGFVNAANGYGAVSTFAIPKDKKIYIEVECTDGTGDNWFAGFASQSGLESGPSSTSVGGASAITCYNRSVYVNGSENDYGSSAGLGGLGVAKLASGDILGCMCDGATGKVWFHRNGTYFKTPTTNNSGTTGDPAGGNHEIGTITNGTTKDVFFVLGGNTSVSSIFVNFGQDSINVTSAQSDGNNIGTFEYAPPTDYLALCASNLTIPAISPEQDTQADDHFNTVLYTGNATARSITGVGFNPDWVWIKPRSDTDNHVAFDLVRGVQKRLYVNTTAVEATRSGDGLSSFNADGFSIGDWNNINENSQTYVAWNWKGGSTAVSNTDGTNITSSVSANPDAGFSIVSWTGTGVGADTVGHGLTQKPEMVICKARTSAGVNYWHVNHKDLTASDYNIFLNLTSAETDVNTNYAEGGIGLGNANVIDFIAGYSGANNVANCNNNGTGFIAYCFHSVKGYSKIGTYVGNSAADGTFVFTGFRVAFLLTKSTSGSTQWMMYDNKREGYNVDNDGLYADDTTAEASDDDVDLLSNGFKWRRSSPNFNQSTYFYIAFAEQPFKYANAR